MPIIGGVQERKLAGTRLSATALSDLEENLDVQKEELKRASIKHAAAVEALNEADEESKRAHEAAEKELREAEEAHARAEKEKAEHEEALRLEREAEVGLSLLMIAFIYHKYNGGDDTNRTTSLRSLYSSIRHLIDYPISSSFR